MLSVWRNDHLRWSAKRVKWWTNAIIRFGFFFVIDVLLFWHNTCNGGIVNTAKRNSCILCTKKKLKIVQHISPFSGSNRMKESRKSLHSKTLSDYFRIKAKKKSKQKKKCEHNGIRQYFFITEFLLNICRSSSETWHRNQWCVSSLLAQRWIFAKIVLICQRLIIVNASLIFALVFTSRPLFYQWVMLLDHSDLSWIWKEFLNELINFPPLQIDSLKFCIKMIWGVDRLSLRKVSLNFFKIFHLVVFLRDYPEFLLPHKFFFLHSLIKYICKFRG